MPALKAGHVPPIERAMTSRTKIGSGFYLFATTKTLVQMDFMTAVAMLCAMINRVLSNRSRTMAVLGALFIICLCCLVFLPIDGADFLRLDDEINFYKNDLFAPVRAASLARFGALPIEDCMFP